jgi:hypothetical protein
MNVRGVLRSRVRMIRNSFRRPKSARGARGSRRGHPALATGVMLLLAVIFGTGLSALFGSLAAGGAGPADTVPILAVVLTAALGRKRRSGVTPSAGLMLPPAISASNG